MVSFIDNIGINPAEPGTVLVLVKRIVLSGEESPLFGGVFCATVKGKGALVWPFTLTLICTVPSEIESGTRTDRESPFTARGGAGTSLNVTRLPTAWQLRFLAL